MIPRCCATEDAKVKLAQEAETLALLAERAALEAEAAELQLRAMKAARGEDISPVEERAAAERAAADQDEPMALRAPLRWIGPYPSVSLSFPALSSPSQKARMLAGDTSALGVTLDFVIDTAANTNTINAQVAGPTSQGGLELSQVGSVAGGVGAGGAMGGGATYLLGTAELADVPKEERVPFISALSATALPVAAPAAAGLLGLPFLNSFAGGVEFEWGAAPVPPGTSVAVALPPASLTFYGDERGTQASRAGLRSVEVSVLAGSALPSVALSVNGVTVPALLDTGSPITVLNRAAAEAADVRLGASNDASSQPANPFARLVAGVQAAAAAAQAETLTVAGVNGPVQLTRAQEATVSLGDAEFGECRPYVGELPGLSALDGLGASAGPAAILGTDVLRLRPRLVYTQQRIYV